MEWVDIVSKRFNRRRSVLEEANVDNSFTFSSVFLD